MLMKVATAADMRRIDERTIRGYGIPASVLMERAGVAVAHRVMVEYAGRRALVLCGGGNNGGDGLVAARALHAWGQLVRVLVMAQKDRMSPDCLAQERIARKLGVPVEFTKRVDPRDLHGSVVVDALLGTGLNKPVTGPMAAAIRTINGSDAPVVSIDMPSGISADTGQIMREAIRSDCTVTFGLPKPGLYLHPGAGHAGRIFVADIGFPPDLLESDEIRTELFGRTAASALLPERPAFSHKGDYGHVLVVAGSRGKTGAALMAAQACLRSGAGMVTIGVPETLASVFMSRVTEEMVLPLADTGDGVLAEKAGRTILDFLSKDADVLAIGPGLTAEDSVREIMREVLASAAVPAVLDADGINAAAFMTGLFARAKAPLVLTPHTGEMARLLAGRRRTAFRTLCRTIEQDRIAAARSFSEEFLVTLVLKGAPSIVAEPEGRVFINTSGNPGMATAGSGDVLTGMIAGLLGQGMTAPDASALAVFLHGRAGDIAAAETGMHSLTASDIIGRIPSAFLEPDDV
ncbi:MAG: NAD(P)H-hydrate dehydratase [Thermodesulfovibrionales bacterium]